MLGLITLWKIKKNMKAEHPKALANLGVWTFCLGINVKAEAP